MKAKKTVKTEKKLTLPLQAGKDYEMRNGQKVRIEWVAPPECPDEYVAVGLVNGCINDWTKNGYLIGGNDQHEWDIVADWVEANPKEWRPWKTTEVPLGAEVRNRNHQDDSRAMIIGVSEHGWVSMMSNSIVAHVPPGIKSDSLSDLLQYRDYTLDKSWPVSTRTWHRCGVFE